MSLQLETNIGLGVKLIREASLPTAIGAVRKIVSTRNSNFNGFGEAYVSELFGGLTNAWKLNLICTSNFHVAYGKFMFVFTDGGNTYRKVVVSDDDSHRICIPPKVWYGFRNLTPHKGVLINIIDHVYDSDKALSCGVGCFQFDWEEI